MTRAIASRRPRTVRGNCQGSHGFRKDQNALVSARHGFPQLGIAKTSRRQPAIRAEGDTLHEILVGWRRLSEHLVRRQLRVDQLTERDPLPDVVELNALAAGCRDDPVIRAQVHVIDGIILTLGQHPVRRRGRGNHGLSLGSLGDPPVSPARRSTNG